MPPFQRPTLELAEIVRRHGDRIDAELSGAQRRILRAISSCRTAALGGHIESCDHCHHQRIAYNSCRNRHCPKCQACACARWMDARASELLPVEYFHVVFTLPETFNALALSCGQSKAAGSPHWLYLDPAHLGPEPVPASAHPLRDPRWGIVSRRQVGGLSKRVLPAGSGALKSLPRQVHRWTQTRTRQGPVDRG